MKRLLLALALLVLTAGAFAQTVPQTMNFQGRLAKPDGSPVADGNYSVTFSLYDAAAAGNLLWKQTGTVAAHNGAFSAKLDFSAGFQPNYGLYNTFGNTAPFLEIKIGTNAPLTPRQPYASVAYSLYAANSVYANTAFGVSNGVISAASLAPGLLSFGNISGQIAGSQIAPGAIVGSITSAQAAAVAKLSAIAQPGLVSDTQIGSYNYNGIKIVGRYAYMLKSSYGNFQVYDLANSAQPVLLSDTYLGFYSSDFAIAGHYAYILCGSNQKLEIVDITNPAAPALISTTALPAGSQSSHITILGSTAAISSSVTASGTWNVALYTINGAAAPVQVSSFSVGQNGYPGALTASGSALYVTDSGGVDIYDITTPAAPAKRGSVYTYGAQSFAAAGNTLYVGGYGAISAVDVSNPIVPALLGSSTIGTGRSLLNIAASGSTVSVLAAVYPGGSAPPAGLLLTYDFTSPTAPVLKSTLMTDVNPSVIAATSSSIFVISQGDFNANGKATLQDYDLFGTLQVGGSLSVMGGGYFSGSVGIGTTTPAYQLDVNGDINASGSVRANGIALTSDARYKTNIHSLANALDDVLALRGVTYDYDRARWPAKNFPTGRQMGFIAQEIETVFPELVLTDRNGYKSVMYQNLTPALVESVKTLKAQLDDKQRQIDALSEKVDRLSALEKENVEIKKTLADLVTALKKAQAERK